MLGSFYRRLVRNRSWARTVFGSVLFLDGKMYFQRSPQSQDMDFTVWKHRIWMACVRPDSRMTDGVGSGYLPA